MIDPFFNANTPEDVEIVRAVLDTRPLGGGRRVPIQRPYWRQAILPIHRF